MCSLWQHQQHKYANLTSESWYVNEINKLQEKKWYLKLTWAKTDDILDSIPFKVVEVSSVKSAKYAVCFWACMVRAQIRGWGSDYGNFKIRALIACLIY